MTTATQRSFLDLEHVVQERVNFLHDTLNERLELKDRWITDRFSEVDKRLLGQYAALEKEVEALNALLCAEIKALKEWTDMRVGMGQKRFEDYVTSNRAQTEQLFHAHDDMHTVVERNADQFKEVIEQKIADLSKLVEILREERGLFVLRDTHDTKTDALEKLILSLEKTTNERIDTALKQVKENLDSRIQANADRIVKIEQNLQVMNARNQQSIIALGILLTLVEIIVRFYN